MAKKEILKAGQIVWLETTSKHGCDVKFEDEPRRMKVLEANNTSAYIWFDGVKVTHKVRYKVDQKTHRVAYTIPDGRSYRLWVSKEDYEQNMICEKELKELKEKLHNTIDVMSLSQLRTLNKSLFD